MSSFLKTFQRDLRMTSKVAFIFWLLPFFFLVVSEGQLCRSRGLFLQAPEFMAETCALCYIYIPPNKFKFPQAKWNMTGRSAHDPFIGTRLTNGTLQVEHNFGTFVVMHHYLLLLSSNLDCGQCIRCPKSSLGKFC